MELKERSNAWMHKIMRTFIKEKVIDGKCRFRVENTNQNETAITAQSIPESLTVPFRKSLRNPTFTYFEVRHITHQTHTYLFIYLLCVCVCVCMHVCMYVRRCVCVCVVLIL